MSREMPIKTAGLKLGHGKFERVLYPRVQVAIGAIKGGGQGDGKSLNWAKKFFDSRPQTGQVCR